MYDNILHKALQMRLGASTAAWSILQALLEKDHTRRLGHKEDFVSLCCCIVASQIQSITDKCRILISTLCKLSLCTVYFQLYQL